MRNTLIHLASLSNLAQSETAMTARTVGTRLGLAGLMATMSVSQAFAAGTGTDPGTYLTAIVTFITGAFGQSLAILGVIAIGLAWMFGRASLGLVAGVVGGIVIMFGASYMVGQVVGTGG